VKITACIFPRIPYGECNRNFVKIGMLVKAFSSVSDKFRKWIILSTVAIFCWNFKRVPAALSARCGRNHDQIRIRMNGQERILHQRISNIVDS
jgi:hypothetical protein